MANGGRIDFTIGYKVDEAGIAKIRHQLEELSSMSALQIQKANPNLNVNQARAALLQIRDAAGEVQTAMQSAFNQRTGVMNLERLRSSLQNLNLQQIQTAFSQAGATGQNAFLGISKAALTTSVQLRQTEGILDRMGQTLANTIRWSISSSAINAFTGAVQQAYGYVQHLDTSLNDIRIVTGKSADEMDRFAEKANEAAKGLGASTTEYTEAALIYYQQGLSDEEAQARAETTLKAANVTGQTGREVSEELTAVWNGYKVTAEETELYVDKLAAVAATTASDLEELSTGMSKVASAANAMGVDVDQLNGMLSTIISVTRQAPETAGTALKTIFARIEDLKISGKDEDGVKLGEVSSTLDEVGVHIIDAQGNMRDLGEVIEEVAGKWDTWTDAQQTAIAQAMAGKRQYNNLLALFNNWDMYTDAVETSRNSMGTLQEQQDVFMTSTEAHLQQLQTQWEDLYDSLLTSDDINSVVDALTKLVSVITDIVDATGGLRGSLLGIVGLIGTTFSKQVANAFGPMITNMHAAQENAQILNQLLANINYQQQTGAISGRAAKEMTRVQSAMSQYWSVMSEAQINASQETIREIGDWASRREAIDTATQSMRDYFATYGDQRSQNIVSNNTQITDFQKTNTDVEYLEKRLIKGQRAIEGMVNYSNQLERSMNQTNTQVIKFGTNSRQVRTQLANVNGSVVQIERHMERANRLGLIDPQQLASAQNLITKIRQEVADIQNPNSRKTSFTQGLIDDLVKLSNLTETSNARIQGFLDTLQTGASKAQDCDTAMQGLEQSLRMTELRTQQMIQGVTQLVGGLSSLFYGINSITNLGSIFTDDSLDGVEKFKQAMMSLLMGIPMIIRGVSSLSTGLQQLTQTESFGAAIISIWTSAQTAAIAAARGLTGALGALRVAITAVSTAIQSIPVIGWVLAGITVAITGITTALKIHQQHLENDAEAAKENAKAQQEVIDKSREEKEKVDSLAKSYEDLLNQRNEDNEFSKEQKQQVYDLIRAYGDQSLIIQALAGDYDGLRDSIRGAQQAANDKLVQDLEEGQQDYYLQFESGVIANAKTSQRDAGGFDLSGLGGLNSHNDFRKDLQKLLGVDTDVIDASGHIGYDALIELFSVESKQLQEFLDKYKDLKATQQLRELLSENTEVIKNIKENKQLLEDAKLDQIGYSFKEQIENIKDTGDFSNVVQELADEAFKKGAVKTHEEGEEWAEQFLEGYSDELKDKGQKSLIADAIFDAILPTEEESQRRMKKVSDEMMQYQKGGNVDLFDRQAIKDATQDGSSYSTVSTQTVANEEGTLAINFTPYFIDDKGQFHELSSKELEDYGQEIINGVHDDYYKLQIGAAFTGEDAIQKASAAGQRIHELQAEYYADELEDVDRVYDRIDELNDSQKSFIADNIDLFKALYDSGYSIEDIFDNLSTELDALSHKDHVVNIDVLLNNKEGSKDYKEAIQELFGDEDFDIGISLDDFQYLEDDEKALILLDKRRQEAEQYNQLTEENKKRIEERNRALDEEITKNNTIIEQKRQELALLEGQEAEKQKTFQEETLEGQQTLWGDTIGNFEDIYNKIDLDTPMEEFKQHYTETLDELAQVYETATAEGKDGMEALADQWDNLVDDDVSKFLSAYAEDMKDATGETREEAEVLKDLVSQWGTAPKKIKDLQKELVDLGDEQANLSAQQEELTDTTFNWRQATAESKTTIGLINKGIDNLQKSYQSLQSITKDYNEDHKLSLDNVQALMDMDDAYVASLEIENGQMSINNDTIQQMLDLKIQMMKTAVTDAYLNQLATIAAEQNVQANKDFIISEINSQEAINGTIEAAGQGIEALTAYARSKSKAFEIDPAAAEEATKAYYNRMQMLDNLATQSTSEILGKTDKSKTSKTKEAKEEKKLEREVDLYREVNEQLEQIESTLGRIQKQNSYKWGKDLQKGLERENKLLDQQLDKLKQKAEIQKGDLAQRRANLEAQGIQFSKDGSSMKNAEATLDKMYAQYNSMVDTYNAMSADQQEEYKKQLEAKKKDIDKMENDLKNYESLFGEYQSMLDELQELHYKQIENAVERFNNMVDVHLELDDAKKEWNDFWYEVVQDVDDTDFGGKIAQSMGKLKTLVGLGGKASKSQIGELTDHLNQTTEEAIKQMDSRKRGGEDSMFENATKLTKENLEKYRDALMDAVREAKEEVDNIGENYLKTLDSAQELIDNQVDGLETISDHLEHNIELLKMVEGAQAYEPVIREYEKLYENDLRLLNTQRQNKEFLEQQIKRYQDLLAVTEKGTVQWKTYSEGLTKATKDYQDAVEKLDKTLQDTLKHLDESRKEQVEDTFKKLDKKLSKDTGLDMVEEEWKLINDLSSRYLDNVERALEIEMYSNDLEKAANATGLSAKNQERLNKFRDEELKKLKEKEKLTQYDIDESRARLAIMQAEMALEDQRANKSKMRLRRDSQGNYNYQYVGDEGAEEEAENGLLTAKKEWYELVKKRYKEVYDYNIELRKEWIQYLEEANEAEQNKEYEKAEFLRGVAGKVYQELEQNNKEINKNSQDLISGTAQFFSDVENASVLPTSKTVATTLINDTKEVGTAGEETVKNLQLIQQEYVTNTDKAITEAGIKWKDYRDDGVDPTADSLGELVISQDDLKDRLGEVNTQLNEQQQLLAEAEQGYRNLRDAAVEAIADAEAALERLAQTTIDANKNIQASITAANNSVQSTAANSPSNVSTATSSGDPNQGKNGVTVDNTYHLAPAGVGGENGKGSSSGQSYGGLYQIVDSNGNAVTEANTIQGLQKYKKRYKTVGLATGGYTGDWSGSDGKLAFLHQKELVLNESDTSNLLKVITMLRDVVASMNFGGLADSLVNSTAQWMNSMSARSFSNGGVNSISNVTNDTNNYKSMVVNADFSGVRSADAIYQALVELENYGMQQNYSTAPHASKSY